MTLDRPAELFTSYDLGVFCVPEFSAYKNSKYHKYFQTYLQFVCFPLQKITCSGFLVAHLQVL